MKPFWITLASSIVLSFSVIAQNEAYQEYIELYKDIAINEMERAGIPASIKLAQGILESNAGRSYLARNANNHFGIKCHSDWSGKKYYRKDDDYDEHGKLLRSCFRAYKDARESFIAHSEFLRDPNKEGRYGFLFRIDPRDFKKWARGLKKSGYATSATYHEKLIYIIETYELHKFDLMSGSDLIAGNSRPLLPGVMVNNDVRFVLAKEGDSPERIASRTGTNLSSILKWNEGLSRPGQELDEKERVYIQPKRNNYRGKDRWHYVREGETLYDIAQKYGIKLESLCEKNRLQLGQQVAVNERIKIRGWKVSASRTPALRTNTQLKNDPEPLPESPIFEEEAYLDMQDEEEMAEELTADNVGILQSKTVFEPQLPDASPKVVFEQEEKVEQDITVQSSPVKERIHTVKNGDTLYNISRRYGMSVPELKALNGLGEDVIRIGQRLILE